MQSGEIANKKTLAFRIQIYNQMGKSLHSLRATSIHIYIRCYLTAPVRRFTNQCSQWKIVKKICKDLPDIGVAIPANKWRQMLSVISEKGGLINRSASSCQYKLIFVTLWQCIRTPDLLVSIDIKSQNLKNQRFFIMIPKSQNVCAIQKFMKVSIVEISNINHHI